MTSSLIYKALIFETNVQKIRQFFIWFFTTLHLSVFGQPDYQGLYEGILVIPGQELLMQIEIEGMTGDLKSFLSVPIQGLLKLKADETRISNDSIYITWKILNATLQGTQSDERIKAIFVQHGIAMPIELKAKKEKSRLNRPQEPKPPFPYSIEEVKIHQTKDDFDLAGTLTIPTGEGPFPAAILITGSGPQDRNSTILGHQPFWVMADHLSRNGIVVLRVDDRGVGQSGGSLTLATSEDFADDISACVDFMQEYDHVAISAVGLIGHSEGGMIAPMLAAKRSDLGFTVLLAAPGVPGHKVLSDQNELIFQKSGLSKASVQHFIPLFDQILIASYTLDDDQEFKGILEKKTSEIFSKLKASEKALFGKSSKAYADGLYKSLRTPWFRFFLSYDPSPALKKVKCPVLALNGENDLQISHKLNLGSIRRAMEEGGNTDFTEKSYPKLNHLFQTSTTGLVMEYGAIEETFNVKVLKDITDWILVRK